MVLIYLLYRYAVVLLLLISLASPVAIAKELVMVTGNDPKTSFQGRWLFHIYSEVFARAGIKWKIKVMPGKRRSVFLDAGRVDGELSRVASYGEKHPNLVRVDESTFSIFHSAFIADPEIKLEKISDLKGTSYIVNYRRGAYQVAKIISPYVKPENIERVNLPIQGIKKLLLKRSDLYISNDNPVFDLLKTKQFSNTSIRKAFTISRTPIHAYMHKKHLKLVPQLTVILRQIKKEGLIEKYRKVALK